MRPKLPAETVAGFWRGIREGMSVPQASAAVGVSRTVGSKWLRERGGVKPSAAQVAVTHDRRRRLSFAEREDVMVLSAQGLGVRAIARQLRRDPGTISRELRRVQPARPDARVGYRASTAQAHADQAAKRPKSARLATHLPLRQEVELRLKQNHSPEQISNRLRQDYPDDPEMWVSHETIYQSLYVQSRGALKRELVKHLRTGRALRKPRRRSDAPRPGRIRDMVPISQRPAEAADRAVPGHWEGDLILGSAASGSAVGTLVERTTRFTMLLHLPDGYTADKVAEAMIAKIDTLPAQLRRSLAWDQGKEMTRHAKITTETGMAIYFCDPHSPWQRPSNENTNGLLRQYLPKGTDLSFYGAGMLDNIAAELNARPRKTLGWRTPSEALEALLSEPTKPTGVADTA